MPLRCRCQKLCADAGRREFSDLALRVLDGLAAQTELLGGLAPIMVDPETGRFASRTVSLGARGDSYYEYLLKQWLLSGKRDESLLRCGIRAHCLDKLTLARSSRQLAASTTDAGIKEHLNSSGLALRPEAVQTAGAFDPSGLHGSCWH